MRNLEVELRGKMSDDEYQNLITFLDQNGTDKELDNRKTVFFKLDGKTLKVTSRLSKNTAKIALKMGDILSSKFQEEFELNFNPEEFDIAVNIFKNLGFDKIQYTTQNRINYKYKGFDFSVKWSEDWGYHFEIDTVVDIEEKIDEARTSIRNLAEKMGLKIMMEEEFKRQSLEINKKHNTL